MSSFLVALAWIAAVAVTAAVLVGIYVSYPRKARPAPPARKGPAEHCGHQPPLALDQSATECVLRPGHAGSHADANGTRWWTNRFLQQPQTSTGQPVRHTVDTITSDALDALYERLDNAQETELARQLATADRAFTEAHRRATRLAGDLARAQRAHASTILQAQRQAARARDAEAQLGTIRDIAAWLEERLSSNRPSPSRYFTAMLLRSIADTRKEPTS
ncbi:MULTISPECIES: hypothetical protein [unclassified Streptomyces]|uniref:hypothetical protein n=1 Tax=unclassified Streptomyces TaxID=2593676 RepID=UPI00226F2E18|nr:MULTISPECIES: hypothetical protein [unclassified Streptomyces]MCY0921860.1 hypothetical protein [Streptomyces sp. H27-G5]MCY0957190.1 hypothetical protein [Streptomyces sp. H27-H5]